MEQMKIRKTEQKDLARVMELYAQAREFMRENGNPNQWGPTNWPPEQLIVDDIQQGHSYVCTQDEQIVGVFYYDYGRKIEPTYDAIDGAWIGSEEYGVIHRIAADAATKGVGSFCLKWVLEQCGHLRIDTHPDNVIMQKFLLKHGFTQCGVIHVVEDPYPRYAYERIAEGFELEL